MQTVAEPDTIELTDAVIEEFVSAAQKDFYVGVRFDGRYKVYCYLAPSSAHVGSLVVVPGNWYHAEPQVAEVVTLNPRRYPGPVKRVLEVLS